MATPNKNFIDIPGHPGVKIEIDYIGDEGGVRFSYVGNRDEILALGIVTAETLEPWRKGQPRGKRDTQGDRVWIDRYYSVRGGVPVQRFRVRPRNKSIDQAMLLPGVPEAVKRYRAERGERDAAEIVAEALTRARLNSSTLH